MPNTREKLIELLRSAYGTSFNAPYLREHELEPLADHLVANGVTVAYNLSPTEQQWIPVTERLPEEWTNVLALSECGFCEVAVYLGCYSNKWRVTWNHDMLDVKITHWMPLPPRPKGE